MNRFLTLTAMLAALIPAGCQTTGVATTPRGATVPLFTGMGTHGRTVTTSSPLAQKYFNQGLVLTYAFNHDEAIRSFEEVTRQDPNCAMAWWGIAYCNGPHINNPEVDEAHAEAAWHALQKALALKAGASERERALIDALTHRYAWPAPSDRRPLDEAFARAMADVWKAYPDDADIGTLYAESLMNLYPWDLWSQDGTPRPDTLETIAVLEAVQRIDPDHPGANHLYIHAIEPSPNPEKAITAADRLRDSVPAAGHLVHMPSHIDVLVGQWAQASKQNELAIRADRRYRSVSPRQGFYHLYMAHNHHMLAFASMMEGRFKAARQAAREMIAGVPEEFLATSAALIDPYMSIELEVLMRFGRWDDILALPQPRPALKISNALWHFGRGVAFAAKGQVDNALDEQSLYRSAAAQVPSDAAMVISPASDVLGIAEHMLAGEIAFRQGKIDESVSSLRRAAAFESNLKYMEPPEWIQPVRHALGAVLLSAGRFADAEQVYREDLGKWPENGWSLYGLSRSLRGQGKTAEADETDVRFRKAWARADTRIDSSCLCVPGV